jgi:hypothetical protein
MHATGVIFTFIILEEILLLSLLYLSISLLFFARLRSITQLIHRRANILSTLSTRVEPTHLAVFTRLTPFLALSTGGEVIPIFVGIITVLMAVGVRSSALLIFSIAVLLTLLIGVVASSSCEELVEFSGEMSVPNAGRVTVRYLEQGDGKNEMDFHD